MFMVLVSVIGCTKEEAAHSPRNNTPDTKSSFDYLSVGSLHNEFLDSLFASSVDKNDPYAVMDTLSYYMNAIYNYEQDFYGMWESDECYMEYIDVLSQDTSSASDMLTYIQNNCSILNWEYGFLEDMVYIIDSQYDHQQISNLLDDLESDVLKYSTLDTLNRYRLLASVSVAEKSLIYWEQVTLTKWPSHWREILVGDALGVYASSSQIATASMFGPWWGAAYAAGAAAASSTIVASSHNWD